MQYNFEGKLNAQWIGKILIDGYTLWQNFEFVTMKEYICNEKNFRISRLHIRWRKWIHFEPGLFWPFVLPLCLFHQYNIVHAQKMGVGIDFLQNFCKCHLQHSLFSMVECCYGSSMALPVIEFQVRRYKIRKVSKSAKTWHSKSIFNAKSHRIKKKIIKKCLFKSTFFVLHIFL